MGKVQQKAEVYNVFTRINRGDNLLHIGIVQAESDDLAKVYANKVYDEEDWVEMCVVKRSAMHWVSYPKGLFEEEGVEDNDQAV